MRSLLKWCVVAMFIAAGLGIVVGSGNTQTKIETAGQKFKSIKVLNDMPADQMGKVMNMMSASLGVNCNFCHSSNDGDYEKEGFEHKDIAREMLKMTFDINEQFFKGISEVSCNTCHNGQKHPLATPNLSLGKYVERLKQPKVAPTVAQILAKYEKALGGKEKIAKVKGRTIESLRLEPDGKTTEPETVIQSATNFRVETKYGDYVVAEIFDGTNVTKTGGGSPIELKPDEAEQIKREAQLFATANLVPVYSELKYKRAERIDGRDVYVVVGTLVDSKIERLYFDAVSGFLVRRVASTPTVLGAFEYQVDYNDYKDFGGVKLPTLTRFAVPAISWTRKILKVKITR